MLDGLKVGPLQDAPGINNGVDHCPQLLPEEKNRYVDNGGKVFRFDYLSDANEPAIPGHTVLTVVTGRSPSMGDFVVYDIDLRIVVGRYVPSADGVLLRFVNSDFEEIKLSEIEGPRFIGVVKEYSRKVSSI